MARKAPKLTGSLDIQLQPKQKIGWDYVTGGQYTWIGFGGSKGGGKLSPVSSFVSTPKGPRRLGDLKLGDSITDPTTGGATRVVQIFEHEPMPVWRATFDDGATLCVGADHLWAFYLTGHTKPRAKRSVGRAYASAELGAGSDVDRGDWSRLRVDTTIVVLGLLSKGKRIRIPLTEPVIYTLDRHAGSRELTPYLMGLFLGDGHMGRAVLTTMEPEIRAMLLGLGYSEARTKSRAFEYRARGKHGQVVRRAFRDYGLAHCRSWEKFIPEPYLRSSLADRMELLRGLMDTDGTVDDRGRCYYTTTSERLRDDVLELVRSMGGKARAACSRKTYVHRGERRIGRPTYRIRVWMKKLASVFGLPRKSARVTHAWNGGVGALTRRLVSLERAGDQQARCITVSSPFGLYVAGDTSRDFVVTHNSGAARRILIPLLLRFPGSAALLVRKTYEEVLKNHVERINLEFPQLTPFYNKSDKMFRIPGANGAVSRLHIGYGEHEGDVRRYNGTDDFGWIYVDQAEEFPEADINTLRTCLRSTVPGVNPALVLSFNPGGPSHMFLKRIFKDRQFRENENPEHYGPLIEARGWDNVEWCRSELEKDGYSVEQYYYEWDEEQRKSYFLNSSYGKNLLANPDKTLRDWYLWGNWDTYAGRYFDQFDAAKHTYRPESVNLEDHYYRWISCDYGFAHDSAVYWHCYDGNRIYTYRELTVSKLEPADLAHAIVALTTKNETIGAFYLSHETFGTRQSVKTQAMMMAEVLQGAGFPAPAPPDLDRVGGLRLMSYMLTSGEWVISLDCPKLISVIPNAVRDPKNPEQTLKFEGDDPLDAARYGIKTYQRKPVVPLERQLDAAMKSTDPTIAYLQRALTEAKLRAKAPRPISLGMPRKRGLRRMG